MTHQNKTESLTLENENATLTLGAQFASVIQTGLAIFLHGELGAGKTTFVRGFLQGLGYHDKVKSPTYTIVEPYEIVSPHHPIRHVFHFDLYRMKDASELEYIGIHDYFSPRAICLVEWAEKGMTMLPPADLACYIDFSNKGRVIRIQAFSPRGVRCLESGVRSQGSGVRSQGSGVRGQGSGN